jgi:GntR family transcriptional regulator, transcriptional repressor for pyruvate dehydrogenase complex
MIRKVKRDTLSEQVTQHLMELISEQALSPGDSLPSESRLAEDFGASRPVIREALKTLQGEGIIEIVTGKNAVIKPISSAILRKFFERAVAFKSASFRDLIEVRRGLEIQSVMLAAERCSRDDLTALEEVLQSMRDNLHAHERFAEYDVQFHLLIASAAQNPIIYYLIESIRDAMHENVLLGLKHRLTEDELERVQACHETILQALTDHNVMTAQLAMQAHFDEALRALIYEKE